MRRPEKYIRNQCDGKAENADFPKVGGGLTDHAKQRALFPGTQNPSSEPGSIFTPLDCVE